MGSELRAAAPVHATGAVEFVPLDELSGDPRFRLREEGDVAALASSLGRLGQLVPVELRPIDGASDGGPRWQVVAGFRRIAALRLLCRDTVLARLHGPLPDEEAWALALAHAVLGEPLTGPEIEALRARLATDGAASWAGDALDEALARAPMDAELRERFFEFLKGPLPPVVERYGDEEESAASPAPTEAATSTTTPTSTATPTATPSATSDASATPTSEATGEPGDFVEVDADELLRGLAMRLYEVNQDLAAAFASWDELPIEGRRLVLAQARYVAELFPFLQERPAE